MNFSTLFLFLSLLFLFKNTNAQVPEITENTHTATGMVLLNKMELMDYPSIEKNIMDTWDLAKEDIEGNDLTISFKTDSTTFLIGLVPAPVPGNDLATAVEYCYRWKDARRALDNQSHIVIAVVGEKTPLELYKYFTEITAIILANTRSTGVFLNNQALLLSKEFFLTEAAAFHDNHLPLYLWIYFGRQQNDKGNSVFTLGMKEFGMNEMEITDSPKPLDELMSVIFDTAHWAILHGKEPRDGHPPELPNNKKITTVLSNGINLNGKSLKIMVLDQ